MLGVAIHGLFIRCTPLGGGDSITKVTEGSDTKALTKSSTAAKIPISSGHNISFFTTKGGHMTSLLRH